MRRRLLGRRRRGGGGLPPVTDDMIFHMNFANPDGSYFFDTVENGRAENLGATQEPNGIYFDGVDDYLKFDPRTIKMPEALGLTPSTYCFWYQKEAASDILTLMDASEGNLMRGLKVIIRADNVFIRYGGNGQFGGNRRQYETGTIIDINNTDIHLLTIKPNHDQTTIAIGIDGVEYTANYTVGGYSGFSLGDNWYYHFMNNRNNYGLTGIPTYSRGWIYRFFQYNRYLTQAEMDNITNTGI